MFFFKVLLVLVSFTAYFAVYGHKTTSFLTNYKFFRHILFIIN